MKREGHIYLLVGLVAAALVFLQYNPFRNSPEKIVSEVKQITGFSRLFLDVDCNIFFVEGENPGIVYEGTAQVVKNICIDVTEGCVTITNKQKGIASILESWLNPGKTELLNIYVVVKDINAIETGNLLNNAGSSNILNDRMIIMVNNNNKVEIEINSHNQKG